MVPPARTRSPAAHARGRGYPGCPAPASCTLIWSAAATCPVGRHRGWVIPDGYLGASFGARSKPRPCGNGAQRLRTHPRRGRPPRCARRGRTARVHDRGPRHKTPGVTPGQQLAHPRSSTGAAPTQLAAGRSRMVTPVESGGRMHRACRACIAFAGWAPSCVGSRMYRATELPNTPPAHADPHKHRSS